VWCCPDSEPRIVNNHEEGADVGNAEPHPIVKGVVRSPSIKSDVVITYIILDALLVDNN
jgi:hypothetical protein